MERLCPGITLLGGGVSAGNVSAQVVFQAWERILALVESEEEFAKTSR